MEGQQSSLLNDLDTENDQLVMVLEKKKEELVNLCAKLLDVEENVSKHKRSANKKSSSRSFADELLTLVEQLNSTIEKLYKLMSQAIMDARGPSSNKESLSVVMLEIDKYIQTIRSGIKFLAKSSKNILADSTSVS